MLQPEPLQETSFLGGIGHLWKHSSAWRLVFLAAFAISAVVLFLPPWRWHGVQPVSPPLTSGRATGNAGIPLAHPTVQRNVGHALSDVPRQAAGPARPPQATEKSQAPATIGRAPQEPSTPAAHSEEAARPAPAAFAVALPSPVRDRQKPQDQGDISQGGAIPQQVADGDENCGAGGPMGMSFGPSAPFGGQIVGFLSRPQALKLLDRTQREVNGKIDPAYVNNLRAVIHLDGKPAGARVVVLVPQNMVVHYGEHVEALGGRPSRTLACHYVPNLIVSAGTRPGQ